MDKYKKYLGVIVFAVGLAAVIFVAAAPVLNKYNDWQNIRSEVASVKQTLDQQMQLQQNVKAKLRKLKESVMTSQKKIYTPTEDFGNDQNDTLFFTLYNDVIEMVRANSIKIKSIDYQYNPQGDIFAQQGTAYFICDVDMAIVSNYVNLGKLIQDLYQYPYYIKINKVEVTPYPKDKKILLSTISLRLYAHTTPEAAIDAEPMPKDVGDGTLNGATAPLPQ